MSYEFKPTSEQEVIANAICNSVKDNLDNFFNEEAKGKRIVSKASAGTGKTSTIILSLTELNKLFIDDVINADLETFVKYSPNSLYLVLNSDMRKSMSKTIERIPALPNVEVSTFHKFMLNHLKETFPEIEAKIDYKKSSLSTQDIKNFLDSLFKDALGFKRRENRIPQRTILDAMDRYIKVFLISDALNSGDMDKNIKNDDRFTKIFLRTDDIQETEVFLKPFTDALYNKVYSKNKERYKSIFGEDQLSKEEFSTLLNFIKMTGHFFIKNILDVDSDIPVTHDVYFKMAYIDIIENNKDIFGKYLSIYVDEAQDLDPMTIKMLDTANPTVAYFGDSDQQLYAFKGSVDSLKIVEEMNKGNVEILSLTESFRYRHDIAVLASMILNELKNKNVHIQGKKTKTSKTLDKNNINDSEELYERVENYSQELSNVYKMPTIRRRQKIAVISRTNENVLKNTLEFLRYKENSGSSLVCSIEGSFKKKIKDAIKGKYPEELTKRLNEAVGGNIDNVPLESYRENGKIIDVLAGTEYSFLVDNKMSVADLQILANSRMGEATSDILFLSSHQAKGREYTYVILDMDYFPQINNNESLYELKERMSQNSRDKKNFEDEVNIAYVAITRAKHSLVFYKENNPLLSFFKSIEEKIEEQMSPYERIEFFSTGHQVKYAKGKDSNGTSVYTKEVSDAFGGLLFYELSYNKPDERDIITINEDNQILKNTFYDNGIEKKEFKFINDSVFKKEEELQKHEFDLVSRIKFKEPSQVEYVNEKKTHERELMRQAEMLF